MAKTPAPVPAGWSAPKPERRYRTAIGAIIALTYWDTQPGSCLQTDAGEGKEGSMVRKTMMALALSLIALTSSVSVGTADAHCWGWGWHAASWHHWGWGWGWHAGFRPFFGRPFFAYRPVYRVAYVPCCYYRPYRYW
jgi:hypothetical protein